MDIETVATVEPEPVAAEPSLADHEAQFSKTRADARPATEESSPGSGAPVSGAAAPDGDGSVAGERDDAGRFKKAQSQKARSSDVDTISALTKEYHEAVAEAGLDLEQEPGESNRVFELRKRAAVAKALRDAKKAPAAPVALVQQPAPVIPSFRPNGGDSGAIKLPANFPAAPNQNAFDDYTEYVRAVARWEAKAEYTLARLADDQRQQSEQFASGVRTRFTDARTRYPDFKAVVEDPPTSPIPRGSTIELFTLKHKFGPDVVYHLFKHPDEVDAIAALPDRDDQIAELTLLGQRLTQSTRAAASTGSPAPSVTKPVVRPPNPVRSGAIRAGDEPPGDDASLADHERAYYKRRR